MCPCREVSQKEHPGYSAHLTEQGAIPIVDKFTLTVSAMRGPWKHTLVSEGVLKNSVLLLHPNVAEEVEQDSSMEDVRHS